MRFRFRFYGFLFGILFLIQSSAQAARSYDYPRMLYYSLELLTREPVRKFLTEEFKPFLVVKPEPGDPNKLQEMSESQFIYLLQENPELWPELDRYLVAVQKVDLTDPAQVKLREDFKKNFSAVLDRPEIQARFKLMSINPLKPLRMATADGQPAYTELQFYVDHKTFLR